MAKLTDKQIVDWILSCRDEAEEAKKDRMDLNEDNYDAFHLRHDFSHKEDGQSQEVLSKQSMAVEQIKSFFQQALADLGDWWSAEAQDPNSEAGMLIREHEITKLTNYMLDRANYFSHVGNSLETALLASLAVTKTTGCLIDKPRFIARKKGRGKSLKRWVEKVENKAWQAKFSVIRPKNYFPDPSGKGLYEIENMWPDFYELLAEAEYDGEYDMELIRSLSRSDMSDVEENYDKARETGQNTTTKHRPKPKITEFWGDILDPSTGELCYENVQAVIANDSHLILKPRPNPLWHQRSPYTASPLLEVANSVWHKALMDAPTKHNHALVEMYNLIVDAAMKEVHAISQIRKDWMDNPAQVSNGLKPGTAIAVNSMCPPGGKVIEPVTTTTIPSDSFNVYNIIQQEFNSSALTNDLRNGVMSFRAVKATEVVEASQTITSIFQGMAKNYEGRQSQKELELAWMTTAQNWDLIDKEVFISLFGMQRGTELSQIPAEEVFAATVNGFKFRVFGVTQTLAKQQDYRKLMTLLQTVGGAPPLMEAFVQKYSIEKMLGEIMTSLDIDKYKLEIPQAVQNTMMPQEEAPPEGAPVEGQPDQMSQVPQAGALAELLNQGGLPQTSFPGSPATAGQ